MINFEENKFFVLNRKHLENIPSIYIDKVLFALKIITRYSSSNEYFVCNQDEPYAQDVIRTILKGEECKEAKREYVQKKEALNTPTPGSNGLPPQRR